MFIKAKSFAYTSLRLMLSFLFIVSLCTVCIGTDKSESGIITAASVALREKPSTQNSSVLMRFSGYEKVSVLESVKGEIAESGRGDLWYKVTYSGKTGYVYGPYVALSSDNKFNGYITAYATARTGAGTSYSSVGRLWPCAVEITGEKKDSDGVVWYKIITPYGTTGYMSSSYCKKMSYKADSSFDKTLLQFPVSYHEQLKFLHDKYPNWTFVPDKLSVGLSVATSKESGLKLMSKYFDPVDSKWIASKGNTVLEPGYYYASDTAIKHFLSPENFLTPDAVFMFMPQSYDGKADMKSGIKSIIKGSFMDSDKYVSYIEKAGKESGVSPLVIAGTIIQEQGTGGSSLSSGKYPGYEGYYNFFNFGASGKTNKEIVTSGLKYAKNQGWNTPEKAIVEGAKKYSNSYIKKGQDTYFYKDYNVINQVWWFQYASATNDAISNALLLSKGLKQNNDAALTFKIPVYSDAVIPSVIPPSSHTHSSNNPYLHDSEQHWFKCKDCGEVYNKQKHVFSDKGECVCGYKKETESVTNKPDVVGDINRDGVVNSIDAAALRLHLLDMELLSGEKLKAADINKDGTVSSIDAALLRLSLLEIKQ